MKKLKEQILSLPGWVLLVIMIVLPIFLYEFTGLNIISFYGPAQIIIFYFWSYITNSFLYESLNEDLKAKANIKTFKKLYVFSFVMILIYPLIGGLITLVLSTFEVGSLPALILAILPLIIILILAFRISAKILVTNEKNKSVNYKEYFGTFLSYLFFPIGMFSLQNRIRKIFLRSNSINN